MIGMSDAVAAAFIGMIGLTLSTLGVAIVGVYGNRKRGREAQQDRELLHAAVKPTNGHNTLGEGIAAIEERLKVGDDRFSRIEETVADLAGAFDEREERLAKIERVTVETLALVSENRSDLRKHLEEVDPLIARAVTEWGAPGRVAALNKGKRKKGGDK